MSRCHARCTSCDARRVLKKQPDKYEVLPKCKNCGNQAYWISHWMNRRDTKALSCRCNGYAHLWRKAAPPHRLGSPYCWFRKDGSQRIEGDSDFRDSQLEEFNHYQKDHHL